MQYLVPYLLYSVTTYNLTESLSSSIRVNGDTDVCITNLPECDFHSDSFSPDNCCDCYDSTGNEDYCYDHKRRSQLVAFILQFIFGWCGAGTFYLCQVNIAAPILVSFIFVCCGSVCIRPNTNTDSSKSTCATLLFTLVLGCCVMILWITSLILIGTNQLENKCNNLNCFPVSWNCA